MGGFIHQQDCILLGGVLREEGLNSVLEEGEESILDFLLTQSHSSLSFICSIYLPCTRHYAKNQGDNDEEDKTQISFSALAKISHRFSVFQNKDFTPLPAIQGSPRFGSRLHP